MRFRPIMMTTLAAMMSTLPIALGAGASAELRQPLGIAVVGGLIVSQTPDAVRDAGALSLHGAAVELLGRLWSRGKSEPAPELAPAE